jgi:hypothetical protein
MWLMDTQRAAAALVSSDAAHVCAEAATNLSDMHYSAVDICVVWCRGGVT